MEGSIYEQREVVRGTKMLTASARRPPPPAARHRRVARQRGVLDISFNLVHSSSQLLVCVGIFLIYGRLSVSHAVFNGLKFTKDERQGLFFWLQSLGRSSVEYK